MDAIGADKRANWRLPDTKVNLHSRCHGAPECLLPEQSRAETRRNLGSFRWERQVLVVTIA